MRESFDLLCLLSTKYTIDYFEDLGREKSDLTEKQKEKLSSGEVRDALFEKFTDDVFGADSKIETHEWIKLRALARIIKKILVSFKYSVL